MDSYSPYPIILRCWICIRPCSETRWSVLHGFVTWAASIIASTLLVTYVATSALSMAGSAIGATADVAGNVIGSAGDAVTTAFQNAADNVNFEGIEIDTSELGDNAEQFLYKILESKNYSQSTCKTNYLKQAMLLHKLDKILL